jgi:AcrR family transcriptional regulator
MTAGDDTRTRLVATAERLFAARGIEPVSLREISRESGARNAIATQYHFGDRAGVLAAISAKHQPTVESARHALLDQYERADCGSAEAVRILAAALVRPLAAKLADPDGGPEYLQIHAEMLDRTTGATASAPPSLARWRALIDPLLERDAVRLHRRYTAILHAATELARRARSGPHTDDRLFTSYLVDVVTAILSFPVSAETRHLADERDVAMGDDVGDGRQNTARRRRNRQGEPIS